MKNIWVIGADKREMLQIQRQINEAGSMRAICMLSLDAVTKMVDALKNEETERRRTPSLIVMEFFENDQEKIDILSLLQNHPMVAGVPLLFLLEELNAETEEMCYENGATVVVQKPLSRADQIRMERIAWQHDMTQKYEGILQKQASELSKAKEIRHLNEQLSARNEVLNQLFGRYFSDELVEVILNRPEAEGIGGEKREVTVLMADLRGFTPISENLDADGVTNLLNCFFSEMITQITYYHGIVIEILGDAILAVFGAVQYVDSQIDDAICAAIQMQNQMKTVNLYCEQEGYPQLEMGIGLHHGEVFVGNVGSEKMMRYNVIGQAVNLCSRIEGYSVGGQILGSKDLIEGTSSIIHVKHSMHVTVKGVKNAITIYEITGIEGEESCYLEEVTEVADRKIFERYAVELYQIKDEVVQKDFRSAVLVTCSMKEAYLELDREVEESFSLYTDVKICAFRTGDVSIFRDVYGKVIECHGRFVRIRFTHVNDPFQAFMKEIKGNGVVKMEKNQYGFENATIIPDGFEKKTSFLDAGSKVIIVSEYRD